jgi:DNA-binding CsgD family transcriptional regulator
VLKTSDPDAIATAVRQAFEPSVYFARRHDQRPAPAESRLLPKLTRRELEILQLVSEGRSNRQVAELLWVTDQTVKFHLANIYRKLGVRSRFDASRWAQEHGVLEVAESGEVVTISESGGSNGNGNGHAATGNGTLVPLRRSASPTGTTGRFEGTSR